MNLNSEIQLYEQSGPFKNEDGFQVATARMLDALMAEGKLAWYFSGNNLYRRALSRNKAQAARLGALSKRMGSKKGIHDCIIISHQVTIELKNGKGNYSPEQKDWKAVAEQWGWKCYLAKTPAEVLEILLNEKILY